LPRPAGLPSPAKEANNPLLGQINFFEKYVKTAVICFCVLIDWVTLLFVYWVFNCTFLRDIVAIRVVGVIAKVLVHFRTVLFLFLFACVNMSRNASKPAASSSLMQSQSSNSPNSAFNVVGQAGSANSSSSVGHRSMESKHKPLVILRCKVVCVGDACVGKTALTQVFQSGGSTYPKNYMMVGI
jgi:hypothetical protein